MNTWTECQLSYPLGITRKVRLIKYNSIHSYGLFGYHIAAVLMKHIWMTYVGYYSSNINVLYSHQTGIFQWVFYVIKIILSQYALISNGKHTLETIWVHFLYHQLSFWSSYVSDREATRGYCTKSCICIYRRLQWKNIYATTNNTK